MDGKQIEICERQVDLERKIADDLIEEYRRDPNSERIPEGLRDVLRRRLLAIEAGR